MKTGALPKRIRKTLARRAPFVGCDGEGGGSDDAGRQNYLLFRIGSSELYTGKRLTSRECLDFICDAPQKAILVGFFFSYDVTMILRDLSQERLDNLFAKKERGEGRSPYTYWSDFGIEYLPRNYFAVCRLGKPDPSRNGYRAPVQGSRRVIYETFGFFQTSFEKALTNFGVGGDALSEISAMKRNRKDFDVITPQIRAYCAMECDFLSQMMERLREYCEAADLMPRTWNGAGKLAASLHERQSTPKRSVIETLLPDGLQRMSMRAYYGGRFEVTRTGCCDYPVYEYDINSAYPASMLRLPCLAHGAWARRKPLPGEIYVADVSFTHAVEGGPFLCGLPVRHKKGSVYWPITGNGTYWGFEIDAASKLGCSVKIRDCWTYEKRCDCVQFHWVESLYEYRKQIGSKTVGYPVKLAINSLYGKLAQRVGNPQWGNLCWAGMITSITRAAMIEAASQSPCDILMIATDGIYSKVPLDLPVSARIGDWETSVHGRLFIVQPGLYWGPPKPKTRGIPAKFFEQFAQGFESKWLEWTEADRSAMRPIDIGFPQGTVNLNVFTGVKLAWARGKPETSGRWISAERNVSFDWTRKRRGEHEYEGNGVITYPLHGGRNVFSVPHGGVDADDLGVWEGAREELMEQPDYLDLGVPWKD